MRKKCQSHKWLIPKNLLLLHVVAVLIFLDEVHLCKCSAIKIKCSYIDEFYYATPGGHCKAYYRCTRRGQRESSECDAGSMFDFNAQKCTRTSGTCYEPICIGRTNGIYQDTTHACRRSYTCNSGRIITIENCPPKHVHNGQKCVRQDEVTCEIPQTTAIAYPISHDQMCSGKPNGQYATNNCSEYLQCVNQEVINVFQCSGGYHFHEKLQECLPKQLVPFYANLPAITIDKIVCKNKLDGNNIDPFSIDCTTYVVCKGGKVDSLQQCSKQAVFNGETCVPSPLFQCPLTLINSQESHSDICRQKSNGLLANPQNGCASYIRCISGKVVEANKCPFGQYFDPDKRNCVYENFFERRKCFDRGITLDCEGKPDGFYKEADCKIYYYCYAGSKTEYKCTVGNLFNGDRCVPKSSFICPDNGDDNFCTNLSDGYYRDQNGGCRSYHYCSNGNKITYLCDEGQTFNGIKCVHVQQLESETNSQCRADYLCYGKSDGYHPDVRSNCRNYVFCKDYEKITQLTCRDNNVFNGQKCVRPSKYACPSLYNHRQLNCMPRHCLQRCVNDGFFPDIESGCQSYFFCINGKISSLSCPEGKRFNGEICVAEDKYTCPVFCENNVEPLGSIICPLVGF